ncbi:hypothetical protein EJB05_57435, partial [Eragrostis curvula]
MANFATPNPCPLSQNQGWPPEAHNLFTNPAACVSFRGLKKHGLMWPPSHLESRAGIRRWKFAIPAGRQRIRILVYLPPSSFKVCVLSTTGFTRFSLHELRTATKDFPEENIIGTGSYGTIYKGVLHDGQEDAIKKLNLHSDPNLKSTYDAINTFINLKHENIIRPMGYCHEIVMDLVHLEGKYIGGPQLIDWSSCFHMILGIAQGVHYLHEQQVVHLDLKPENILLGSHMNPRICDFDLAT